MGVTQSAAVAQRRFHRQDRSDAAACALEARGQRSARRHAGRAGERFRARKFRCCPTRRWASRISGASSAAARRLARPDAPRRAGCDPIRSPLAALIDELERRATASCMTMGKGGVGKTTIAAAIAIELAHRGHPVHLSTTDPAAHVAATVGASVPNLSVSRIDPAAETRAVHAKPCWRRPRRSSTREGMALLEEDLRSPCTEEIAVFSAFARTVAEGEHGVRRPRHRADRTHAFCCSTPPKPTIAR